MEQTHFRHLSKKRAGTTLVELMVAAVIMSVGILGLFGAFRYISISLHVSRGQTIATNLAQEKIEVLKNSTYYGLLLSTTTGTDVRFTPNIIYDNGNYPPENITIGNMNFTRYTYVTMADVSSGNIVSVGLNYPDTGLKQIAVNVVWLNNGVPKKWTLTNLLENPSVNPLDATISGNVTISAGGGPLASALVKIEQNNEWSGSSDVNGNYSFQVYHGTYTVRASSAGFYDAVSSPTVVARGSSASRSLTLEKISTGTVAGTAWYNNDLVISQVVVDTYTIANDGNPHHIEYVELFNPTTFTINLRASADAWNAPGTTDLLMDDNMGNFRCDCSWSTDLDIFHVSTFVAPGHYYLFANASSFYINGTLITPDAYYDHTGTGFPKRLNDNNAINVDLYHWAAGYFGDEVGWTNSVNATPVWYYPTVLPNMSGATAPGTPNGQQIVRVSSPVASMADIATYGRAYNSQNNSNDFLQIPAGSLAFVTPKTSASGTFPVISGKVPSGVVISASDQNSSALTAFSTNITSGALSLPYVPFKLTGVTTGTYSVALSYTGGFPANTYSQIITNVSITQNQTIGIPNAATSPAWSPANDFQVQMSSYPDSGFVKGIVTDPNNNPINGITVRSGGYSKATGADGSYFMNVASGTIDLVANPSNANQSYVQSDFPIVISQGAIATQNFVLSLGARLTGFCTTGSTPIPNQVVNALNGGNQIGTATSDGTGIFSINNISTGTYTITPVINIGQSATPSSISVTVNSTGSVFVGTFTVSGDYGNISGTVTDNSTTPPGLVTYGALVVASTGAISSSPPSIVASSAPAQIPTYMISSKSDGTYILPVRGSSTYNLSVYVPIVSLSGTVSVATKTYSGITVSVGGTVTQNVVIP